MHSAVFYDLPSEWVEIDVCKKGNTITPPGLRNHTMCVYTSYLVLIGGQKNILENNSHIYRFDMRTNEWQIIKVND